VYYLDNEFNRRNIQFYLKNNWIIVSLLGNNMIPQTLFWTNNFIKTRSKHCQLNYYFYFKLSHNTESNNKFNSYLYLKCVYFWFLFLFLAVLTMMIIKFLILTWRTIWDIVYPLLVMFFIFHMITWCILCTSHYFEIFNYSPCLGMLNHKCWMTEFKGVHEFTILTACICLIIFVTKQSCIPWDFSCIM